MVMSRRQYLVRVEVQPMRRGLPLILQLHAIHLSLYARLQVRSSRLPRSALQLRRVRELASVGSEERPGDDRPYMEV